jgi:hypothetical protein
VGSAIEEAKARLLREADFFEVRDKKTIEAAQRYADACMDAVLRVAADHFFQLSGTDAVVCQCGFEGQGEVAWRAHVLAVARGATDGFLYPDCGHRWPAKRGAK